MENQSLPRIAVLYGGVGSEREISLISGKAVLKALQGYTEHPVLAMQLDTDHLSGEMRPATDIVLPVLHGEFGEDGTMQRELETAGFEFCGSDARSSALCMDKERTKALLEEKGIPVVPGYGYTGTPELNEKEIISILGECIVAKPVAMGSSIGLCLLTGVDQLSGFLNEKASDPGGWLLEKRIFGREFSVGVLEGKAMGVVEIEVPEGRVYDYEQKYYRQDTRYHCPADLTAEVTRRIQDYAERVFSICGCRDYARIDFLLETETDNWFCLELNTIPGMTPSSLLPKSAGAMGMDFRQLLLRMLAPAITRFKKRLTVQDG
jgi:D-alanine-D-alanine ligase